MKNNIIDYTDIIIYICGQKKTIKECADEYNIDSKMLLKEYLETGCIEKSIYSVIAKKSFLEVIGNYIARANLNEISDFFNTIMENTNKYKDIEKKVYRYIDYITDEDIEFVRDDIVALFLNENIKNESEIKEPMKESQMNDIQELVNFLFNSNDEFITIKRSDIEKIIKILKKYKLPSTYLTVLMNKYLLEDEKYLNRESGKNINTDNLEDSNATMVYKK